MDNGNGKPSGNRFAEVIRIVQERKKQRRKANPERALIDWLTPKELPQPRFVTSAFLRGRGSKEE